LRFLKSLFSQVFRIIASIGKILVFPFRALFNKLFAPPPMTIGGPPVDHSTPDMEDEKEGIRGQVLYLFISVFFIVAVAWAVIAEVDEQVRAEGIIVTPSDVQHVQSRLPGSIVEINVSLGSTVEKGEVMFRLEDEDVTANFADNEISYTAARAAEVRLAAEANGLSTLVFPADLKRDAADVVAKEESLFQNRVQAKETRLSVLREAVEALQRGIAEKEAEARISQGQASLIAEEIKLMEPLVEAGHEPRSMLLSARTRYQQATGSAELAQLAASARRSDLAGKIAEMDAVEANFRAEAAANLVEIQTKAAQFLSRKDALQGKVRHAEIRAPLSGTVSAVHIKTRGAVVQAGSVLADIVPAEAALLVRAQIPPQKVASVKPGQIARISLSAYDPSRYGVLMGVVERVANNTTQPEGQMPFYETMIVIPKAEFTKSDKKPQIVAGMPLTVDILGDKRTIMNYIMTPIQKSLSVAFREQ
jgi:HlyD family type I secretion membrane fusion protein